MTDATLITDGTRPAVRLERQLPDSPATVWRALTEREQLRSWFPCDVIVEGDHWVAGAAITFPFPPEVIDMTLTGEVLEVDEHQVVAMVAIAMIYADTGNLVQALTVARRANAVSPWYLDTVAVLAALLRRSGDAEAAMPLERLLDAAQSRGDAPAHSIFHLLCGNVDQGADWAEKAIDERDLSISIYLRFVVSKDLRASPRWPKIAKMLNLDA